MKFIKYLPHCEELFRALKDSHDVATGAHSPCIRVLCRTRWTVHVDALASVTGNCETVLNT